MKYNKEDKLIENWNTLSWARSDCHDMIREEISKNKELRDLINIGNVPCDFGRSKSDVGPLGWAAKNLDACMVDNLLEIGAIPNVIDSRGWNALHYALQERDGMTNDVDSMNKRVEIVKSLLTYGVNPNHRTQDGLDPVDFAENCGFDADLIRKSLHVSRNEKGDVLVCFYENKKGE